MCAASVPGLPHPQHVAFGFQRPEVGRLVRDVVDDEQHVEDRFGLQAGDRGQPDVFDPSGRCAEGGHEPLWLCLETRWPAGVALGERNPTALGATDRKVSSMGSSASGTSTSCSICESGVPEHVW